MINGRKAKGSLDAGRNGSGKSRRPLFMNDMIDELDEELRLVDKTIAALTTLSRLRQPRPKIVDVRRSPDRRKIHRTKGERRK